MPYHLREHVRVVAYFVWVGTTKKVPTARGGRDERGRGLYILLVCGPNRQIIGANKKVVFMPLYTHALKMLSVALAHTHMCVCVNKLGMEKEAATSTSSGRPNDEPT